ncbi:MAG: PQQ-dependent sugar dehydrogenase [Chloroflexota bacterium]
MIKKIIVVSVLIVVLVVAGLIWWNFRAGRLETPAAAPSSAPEQEPAVADAELAVSLARGLEIPWALDFLPDGSIIFTERVGRIRLVDAHQGLMPASLLTVNDVAARGEGGLLGIAVHPDFNVNGFTYVYYTRQDGNNLVNRVARYIKKDDILVDGEVILDGIPAGNIHNGGRIKFGPDGRLYITTGDSGVAELAQDLTSLAGKILRLEDDGAVPEDNPFPGSPVYSYGHRNPQGLAWDDRGRLWATEHGSQATDELNLIRPGANYGWPHIRGEATAEGMVSPVLQSGGDTWAPSGAAFWKGSIFFSGLRGQSLYQAEISGETAALRRHLERNFGRLREVVVGPDGLLYLLTSNRDGRGVPTADDDQLIRINRGKLD